MLKRLVNEARFGLIIETTGPLLIKSGYATLTGPDMTPVETVRGGEREVYIPGSSLKGVFRNHLEKVIRTLRPDEAVVADPFQRADQEDQSCGAWFEQRKKAGEDLDNATVYAESDPIARLFGSTSFIGRVSIGDAYVFNPDENVYPTGKQLPTELRDGVGIDRLTGGQSHGALFNMSVVSSETIFKSEILLRNFECWQLGGILLVAQDIRDELVRLGSGTSRGLGAVTASIHDAAIHHIGPTPGRDTAEVWGLGHFLGDQSGYGTQSDDTLTLSIAPTQTPRGIRTVQTCEGQCLDTLIQQSIQEFVQRMEHFPVYKSRQGKQA